MLLLWCLFDRCGCCCCAGVVVGLVTGVVGDVVVGIVASCCVGQEALGFVEYIRQIVAILRVDFRAFGAEQILKIAINAEERKRRQSLAQISSEFDLLRLIQTALIQ